MKTLSILILANFVLMTAQAVETLSGALVSPSAAVGSRTLHALTLAEQPKYNAQFQNFDYVNPNAPKGGEMRFGSTNIGYTSLNPGVFKGKTASGAELLFDSLMVSSADDPHALYPRLAKSVEVANDHSYIIFNLNEKARWNDSKNDGCDPQKAKEPDTRSPVTAEDVAFSYESLKKYGPQAASSAFDGGTKA